MKYQNPNEILGWFQVISKLPLIRLGLLKYHPISRVIAEGIVEKVKLLLGLEQNQSSLAGSAGAFLCFVSWICFILTINTSGGVG